MAPAVWIVSELYYPETTSTGYFLTGIAEGLAETHRVRVLCSQPTYSARGLRAPRREVHRGVDIERCWSTTLDKDKAVGRVLNMVTVTAGIFVTALRRFRRGDVALVVTNPPPLPFAIALAARLRGARPLLLVHDVYPEVLAATGVLSAESWPARALSWLSRQLYRRFDRIVVLGRDMRELVARKIPGHDDSIRIIPNWGEVDHVRPAAAGADALRRQLGLSGRFVVQFMGNMGRTHGIDTVAEAARRLHDEAGVHFLFVGWGGRRAWLEELVASERLRNVTILPGCSHEELPAYLNVCDVSVIAFRRRMAGVSVPSRMYNVLAAGKPIIAVADPGSELALVVREEQVGWVVPPEDPAALVQAVEEARRCPDRLAAMGRRARLAAERRYTRAHVALAYRDTVAELGVAPT